MVSKRCIGDHRHCNLMRRVSNNAWREVERYPRKLVTAILRGLCNELRIAGVIDALGAGQHADAPDVWQVYPEFYEEVYDAVSGQRLDPTLLSQSRKKEMDLIVTVLHAYDYDTVDNCLASTGKLPIPLIWVDVNKGDESHPDLRSRMCVAETRRRTSMDLHCIAETFSATPPYEALRFIVSVTMTPRTAVEEEHVLLFLDVTRAHPHCFLTRKVWCKLPQEDPRSNEEGVCATLRRSLYGLRDAGHIFDKLTRETLLGIDFVCGVWSPCLYFRERDNVIGYVYGDNFVFSGTRASVYDVFEAIKLKMWIRIDGCLGPSAAAGGVLEVRCLNRICRWVPESHGRHASIEFEADPRHQQLIRRDLNLMGTSKGVVTPGVKPRDADLGEQLQGDDQTLFRSICMRASYLAEDRPEMRFAVREIARLMSEPRVAGMAWLKRLGRFLVDHPRVVQSFPRQSPTSHFRAYHDSDHAGCLRTRQSTTCVALCHGSHLLKFISATQTPTALSPGESEWYAKVRAASVVIGAANMAKDLGRDLSAHVVGDSTSADGIGNRRGVGKIRHLHTPTLWLQGHIAAKTVIQDRVPSPENPADLGTKHLTAEEMRKHMAFLNFRFADGESDLALKAA